MTSATTQATVKPDLRKRCALKECRKKFTPSHAATLYCSSECQRSVRKVERKVAKLKAPVKIPRSNWMLLQMIEATRHAETVEIFQTMRGDVIEFQAVLKIMGEVMKANIANGAGSFSVCHVDAAKHKYRLGLFSSRNLFAGSSKRNRAQGSFSSGMGESISRHELKPAWSVSQGQSNTEILDLIVSYIGKPTFLEVVQRAKLKESAKHQSLEKLEILVDRFNPEHSKFVEIMDNPKSTANEIKLILAELQSKTVYAPKFKLQSEQAVYFREILRQGEFRYEIDFLKSPILDSYSVDDESGESFLLYTLAEHHLQTLFNLLQGHAVEGMQEDVDALLHAMDYKPRREEEYAARVSLVADRALQRGLDSGEFWYEGSELVRGGQVKVYTPLIWCNDSQQFLPF